MTGSIVAKRSFPTDAPTRSFHVDPDYEWDARSDPTQQLCVMHRDLRDLGFSANEAVLARCFFMRPRATSGTAPALRYQVLKADGSPAYRGDNPANGLRAGVIEYVQYNEGLWGTAAGLFYIHLEESIEVREADSGKLVWHFGTPPKDGRLAVHFDPQPFRQAVAAAATFDDLISAFNTTFGAFYGLTLEVPSVGGSNDYLTWQPVDDPDLAGGKLALLGIATALSHYPAAYVRGLNLDSLRLVHDLTGLNGGKDAYAFTDSRGFMDFSVSVLTEEATSENNLHHELMHAAAYTDSDVWSAHDDGSAPFKWDGGGGAPYLGHSADTLDGQPPGFASDYGATNFAEDVAEVMATMWRDTTTIFERIKTDQVLDHKVTLLLDWLNECGMTALNFAAGWD